MRRVCSLSIPTSLPQICNNARESLKLGYALLPLILCWRRHTPQWPLEPNTQTTPLIICSSLRSTLADHTEGNRWETLVRGDGSTAAQAGCGIVATMCIGWPAYSRATKNPRHLQQHPIPTPTKTKTASHKILKKGPVPQRRASEDTNPRWCAYGHTANEQGIDMKTGHV